MEPVDNGLCYGLITHYAVLDVGLDVRRVCASHTSKFYLFPRRERTRCPSASTIFRLWKLTARETMSFPSYEPLTDG